MVEQSGNSRRLNKDIQNIRDTYNKQLKEEKQTNKMENKMVCLAKY